MNPEQAAKFLFELLTSVEDGVVQVTVARSSLVPACSIKVVKHWSAWRPGEPEHVVADDFAAALEKVRDA